MRVARLNATEYNELSHLEGKESVVAESYEKLIGELQRFCSLKIEPKKTSIHLGDRFGFAGVYTQKKAVNLAVHLNHQLGEVLQQRLA